MFNILEHSQDKLAPVIAYIKAVMNSHFLISLRFYLSLDINKKKMQLVMLLRNQKSSDLKTVL